MKKKNLILSFLFCCVCFIAAGQGSGYETENNIQYYPDSVTKTDSYIKERCVLDIYYPEGIQDYATIVWFHGGGLKGGNKFIPDALKNKGYAIVAVNYRLYPKIKCPVYIEDAAAAVAWVYNNINKYGGDASKIFVSGHSAGGYLTSMVGLDKKWLGRFGVDADNLAGLIPFSGHAITHFTVREERGIKGTQPIIDELAPLFHVRNDAPPYMMITGDRELEMLGRYEENAYMMRMMKVVGHKQTELYELDGFGHDMTEPAYPLLLRLVEKILKAQ
ncbi:alpha/beta hydrolase [Plebeiibacterium marinum]|uniref:Alpha/beta hydrolase n=1 Tax=Plebeiibacterium marinum TaxID=2992111 RepID=A0AAE3SKQ7_9BACT|nr:alpha/beta hydrolase [Plebeiobacterium marinum]MCW3806872.1 alpha/beta hydrolase [Plebeiobacterium marinum]